MDEALHRSTAPGKPKATRRQRPSPPTPPDFQAPRSHGPRAWRAVPAAELSVDGLEGNAVSLVDVVHGLRMQPHEEVVQLRDAGLAGGAQRPQEAPQRLRDRLLLSCRRPGEGGEGGMASGPTHARPTTHQSRGCQEGLDLRGAEHIFREGVRAPREASHVFRRIWPTARAPSLQRSRTTLRIAPATPRGGGNQHATQCGAFWRLYAPRQFAKGDYGNALTSRPSNATIPPKRCQNSKPGGNTCCKRARGGAKAHQLARAFTPSKQALGCLNKREGHLPHMYGARRKRGHIPEACAHSQKRMHT